MTDQSTVNANVEALHELCNSSPRGDLFFAVDHAIVALQCQEEMAQEIENLRSDKEKCLCSLADAIALGGNRLVEIERLKADLSQATQKERERCLRIVEDSFREDWMPTSTISCLRRED